MDKKMAEDRYESLNGTTTAEPEVEESYANQAENDSRIRREVELVDDDHTSNDTDSNSTDREKRNAFYIKAKYSYDKRNKAAKHEKHGHHSRERREVEVVEPVDNDSNDTDSNSTDREKRNAFYIKAKYSYDKRNKADKHEKHDSHHSRKRREVEVVELVDDDDSASNSTRRERRNANYIKAKHTSDKRHKNKKGGE